MRSTLIQCDLILTCIKSAKILFQNKFTFTVTFGGTQLKPQLYLSVIYTTIHPTTYLTIYPSSPNLSNIRVRIKKEKDECLRDTYQHVY